MDITIERASTKDAGQILEIYRYYVENTAVSFEYTAPSIEEFSLRIENITKKYPYLILKADNKILGYAYAGVFKDRKAYDFSVETTIYIHKDQRKKGFGKMLYQALEKELKLMGITNLYACIAFTEKEEMYLTKDSEFFHSKMGYTTCGRFHKCGVKFGRAYDMIWMEKIL